MTLDQLRVFVAVAERQHVTRAAEALHLAQSAASAAIASLEARHGTKLFDRIGRAIRLTDAGAVFLVEARAVLARAEAAERVLSDLGSLRRGTLSIQASQTIASYWLPRHLVAYRRLYPQIDIRLAIGNTAQVAEAVHDGRAELGFVEGEIEDAALASTEIARDQLVIVVAPGHPWAGMSDLAPSRLTESAWVLREAGSGTRSMFAAALAGFGIDAAGLEVALDLPSNESVRAAVEAGLGASALSASVAAPSVEAGLLEIVDCRLPDRAFCLLRPIDRPMGRAAAALLGLITPRPADGSGRS